MAWEDELDSRTGEALSARVRIRDSLNALHVLTDYAPVVSVSPIIRKREREWGIVEGSEFTITLSNHSGILNPMNASYPLPDDSLMFLWADLFLRFDSAGFEQIYANGRIENVEFDAPRGTVRISIRDTLMDSIRTDLVRDWKWTSTGWVSEMKDGVLTTGSDSFDNSGNPCTIYVGNEGYLGNLRYTIKFTNSTTFDIIHEDEPTYNQTGLSKSSDQTIDRYGIIPVVTIPTAGWGATASGDTFYVYTSKKYTSAQMNPIEVLADVLADQIGTALRVSTGGTMSPTTDGPVSSWAGVSARFTTASLEGSHFEVGTSVTQMIEEILVGVSVSIFPLLTGQIGLYHFHPDDAGSGGPLVTGNPQDPDVSVLSVRRRESIKWRSNVVVFSYINEDGVESTYRAVGASPSSNGVDISHELTSAWHWTAGQIEATANQALLRRNSYAPQFSIRGTLYKLAAVDLSKPMTLTEPELDESAIKLQIAEQALDMMQNLVEVRAYNDPTVDGDFARVGVTQTDGSEVIY